jgi:hypothetical protein
MSLLLPAGPRAMAFSNRVFVRDLLRVDVFPWCSIGIARGWRKCLLVIIAMFLLHRRRPLSRPGLLLWIPARTWHGRRAGWLYAADWENLLAEPVDAIRARYRIISPFYYPKVLAAMRAARAAKARATPVAA